jgi:hypothetical protein
MRSEECIAAPSTDVPYQQGEIVMQSQVTKGDRFVKYEFRNDVKHPANTYLVEETPKEGSEVVLVKNTKAPEGSKPIQANLKKLVAEGYLHEPERRTLPEQPVVEARAVVPEKAPEVKVVVPEHAPKSPIPRYRAKLKVGIQATLLSGAERRFEAGRTGDSYYSQGFLWFEPNTRDDDERIPFPINDPDEIEVLGIDDDPELLGPGEMFDADGKTKVLPKAVVKDKPAAAKKSKSKKSAKK